MILTGMFRQQHLQRLSDHIHGLIAKDLFCRSVELNNVLGRVDHYDGIHRRRDHIRLIFNLRALKLERFTQCLDFIHQFLFVHITIIHNVILSTNNNDLL
jgi:hypothetical protein